MLQTLSKGNSNDLVKVAKYLMGYSAAGKATSSFDAKFLTFVKTWQKNHGLSGLGSIGPNTWTKIAENAADPAKDKAARYAVQILFDRVAVNGSWNTVTQNAIKTFRIACGLSESTSMDANAWKELLAKQAVTQKHTVDFKQNDPKWTHVIYSISNSKSQTIGNSGCGPTALSNVIYSLNKDKSITPVKACEYAIKNGARRGSGGTDMEILAPKAKKDFGFSRMIETKSLHLVKHCIDDGGYVVVGVGKGYFTSGGHYMTVWGYDSKNIYLDNPISKIKNKREIKKFTPEVKYYFCFYK